MSETNETQPIRGLIGIEDQYGSVLFIRCLNLSGLDEGSLLVKHYATADKAAALVALGDLSSLGTDLKSCVAVQGSEPVKAASVFQYAMLADSLNVYFAFLFRCSDRSVPECPILFKDRWSVWTPGEAWRDLATAIGK